MSIIVRNPQDTVEPVAEPYQWPAPGDLDGPAWRIDPQEHFLVRNLPETEAEISDDSRWPAFFPSPICLITSQGKHGPVLERVVGATIVNRFPYILAFSVCHRPLSRRHYPRQALIEALEHSRHAIVQFLSPGANLETALSVITGLPDERASQRLAESGLPHGPGESGPSPILQDAFLAYEGHLAAPGKDYTGTDVFLEPYRDVGSHRIYFLEIKGIYLQRDIANQAKQIRWHSLPLWPDGPKISRPNPAQPLTRGKKTYSKGYTADYRFPSADTVAFEYDRMISNWAYKRLPDDPRAQVEIDNDRARWPCFFPSSLGMITTWADANRPNFMPCGSTAIVARQPFTIAISICYAPINDRYAPRATLDAIQRSGRFGCGVGYDDPAFVDAIRLAGNLSLADAPDKVAATGLEVFEDPRAPVLTACPITLQCAVVGEQRMGTHVMVFGVVEEILVHCDLGPAAPLVWQPWANVLNIVTPNSP